MIKSYHLRHRPPRRQDPAHETLWVDDLAFDFVEPSPPPPPVTVRGRVEDPDGGAVAGAVVALSRSLTLRAQGRARTGEDGHFAIEVPAGTYSITATAPGFTAAFQKPRFLGPQETAEEQELVLGRDGFTVSGRVTNERGEPVAGAALVFLRWDSDLEGGQFYVEADAAGRYSVRLAPAETYALEVASEGFTTTTRTIESGVDQAIDVRVVEKGPAPEAVVACRSSCSTCGGCRPRDRWRRGSACRSRCAPSAPSSPARRACRRRWCCPSTSTP